MVVVVAGVGCTYLHDPSLEECCPASLQGLLGVGPRAMVEGTEMQTRACPGGCDSVRPPVLAHPSLSLQMIFLSSLLRPSAAALVTRAGFLQTEICLQCLYPNAVQAVACSFVLGYLPPSDDCLLSKMFSRQSLRREFEEGGLHHGG